MKNKGINYCRCSVLPNISIKTAYFFYFHRLIRSNMREFLGRSETRIKKKKN